MRCQQDVLVAPGDVIRLHGVTKTCQAGTAPAFADVSMRVANGEAAAIMGPPAGQDRDRLRATGGCGVTALKALIRNGWQA